MTLTFRHLNEVSYYGKEEKNNLTPSSLPKWVKQFNNTGSFKEKDNLTEEQKELIELRKKNKQLEMENDILKQAALIMGRR